MKGINSDQNEIIDDCVCVCVCTHAHMSFNNEGYEVIWYSDFGITLQM